MSRILKQFLIMCLVFFAVIEFTLIVQSEVHYFDIESHETLISSEDSSLMAVEKMINISEKENLKEELLIIEEIKLIEETKSEEELKDKPVEEIILEEKLDEDLLIIEEIKEENESLLIDNLYAPPGKRKNDIFISEALDENMTAVIVSRNPVPETESYNYELWLSSTLLQSSESLLSKQSTKEWKFVFGDDVSVSSDTQIMFIDGHLFWFRQNNPITHSTVLWRFNSHTNSYDSMSVNLGEVLKFPFQNQAGEMRIFEIDTQGLTRIFDFVDVDYE